MDPSFKSLVTRHAFYGIISSSKQYLVTNVGREKTNKTLTKVHTRSLSLSTFVYVTIELQEKTITQSSRLNNADKIGIEK